MAREPKRDWAWGRLALLGLAGVPILLAGVFGQIHDATATPTAVATADFHAFLYGKRSSPKVVETTAP